MMTTGRVLPDPLADPVRGSTDGPLPSAWRLGLGRGRIEVKSFFRDKMAVCFIFGLPSILLVLLGSIFGSQAAAAGVTVGQLFTSGMIAGGIMASSFLVCAVTETVLLMAVGMLFYHLRLPTAPGRWWTFAWIFVLGSAACGLLGIAASSLPRSAAAAAPVITLPFTVLQFISGVYVPFSSVPPWMKDLASFFPLKWMAQGLRSVFLPGQAASLEPAHSWEHGRIALVLGAWIVAGLVLCLTTFRWQSRN
jgi:ABC-2 type transport system permease protein